jgi:hypothetical protein
VATPAAAAASATAPARGASRGREVMLLRPAAPGKQEADGDGPRGKKEDGMSSFLSGGLRAVD